MDIDFVVTWVNMDDPEWQNEFAKYSGNSNNTKNGVSKARFRDYGFLKYWFRGIEKFAPWVRKIHFVTSGQKPEWLDENNPKPIDDDKVAFMKDFVANHYGQRE